MKKTMIAVMISAHAPVSLHPRFMSAALTRKLKQAQERLQNRDVVDAQFLCQEILRHAPRNHDALYLFAFTCLAAGRIRDALPMLEQYRRVCSARRSAPTPMHWWCASAPYIGSLR